ncbi:lactate utilization protein [Alkaliphilus hydrothermalis]|uniref:L-lactate utilization protein LutB n=1 Tax=Alkaliphilus hydrothermalis TaxID=1482730 RepID=A0ABS2NPN3_9FIRM|nr:lactate utilization protein [Alkaliphilus hydrothermalis]MBM7614911.1 L-lactate utilization protein LutB [Alkaliphilus hydrothermalis]
MNNKVKAVIENLQRRKIKAQYFDSREAVIKAILEESTNDQVVGIGGSMTIKELNLHEVLKDEGKEIHWHWLVDLQKRNEVRQKAASADVYLTSTNALTETGDLVNIDGVGNRVSAMYYGPKKVIVICGINKITSDVTSAMERIKKEACPPNAKRLGLKTPCAVTGECNDCRSEQRMCNITTIISHKPMAMELHVYIVGEPLGY